MRYNAWSPRTTPALGQAVAAAQHQAWHIADPDAARRVFANTLRQLLGADRADTILISALAIFAAQPSAPPDFIDPPTHAEFGICPRCQALRKTKYTIPQHGRTKLAVLRDGDWLRAQLEQKRTTKSIAEQLECSPSLVIDWLRKHGILAPRAFKQEELDQQIGGMHRDGDAPGEISRALEMKVEYVRASLKRQGLATMKRGHHYFAKEWWVERLVTRGWSTHQCARAAGIKRHATVYFLDKFDLRDVVKGRATIAGKYRRRTKYPVLQDAAQLAELIRQHVTYEAVAGVVGCNPQMVSAAARSLLGVGKRHENFKPTSARSWWTERLDRGLTTWQLAEEAEITERSARERLRQHGSELLAQGYHNNTAAERARRKAS